jgi:predicted restriction endonuclease
VGYPERLYPHNGLLLLPQYDRLFDRGFITFDEDDRVLLSDALPTELVPKVGVHPGDRLRFVRDQHRPYFDHHRRVVVIKPVTGEPEGTLSA